MPDVEEVCTFKHHAPPGPMNLERFKGLSEFDGRYFVTTFNEILVIEKESSRLVHVYSRPSFNDLYTCFAYEKGQVVANTGMDCVEVFDLVYVATPLQVCEQRGRKGLNAKARAGLLKQFTGISDPYEPPDVAEVVIDSSVTSAEQCAEKIMNYVEQSGFISLANANCARSPPPARSSSSIL